MDKNDKKAVIIFCAILLPLTVICIFGEFIKYPPIVIVIINCVLWIMASSATTFTIKYMRKRGKKVSE